MNDVKDVLRDIGYFGVGAAAVIIETGSKAIKCLVQKGEKTLRENQDTVDDLKRRAKDLGDKVKDAVEKAAAKPEPAPVDASAMTPEERAELRRQLDEADAACMEEAPCEDCPSCEEIPCEAERPEAPEVIYHAAEPAQEPPAEEDDPQNTVNG